MSPVHCILCGIRVSDSAMANGKTETVDNQLVHKSCLKDYKLRMGVDYAEVIRRAHEGRKDA